MCRATVPAPVHEAEKTKAAASDGSGGKGLLPFLRRLCVTGPIGRLLTGCAVPQSRLQYTQPKRRRLWLAFLGGLVALLVEAVPQRV